MHTFFGYTALALALTCALLVAKRPQLALALFISMYGAEQLITSSVGYFAAHTEYYNYAVGFVCVAAILVSLFRDGVPRIDVPISVLFLLLVLLTTASLLWTNAPIGGAFAIKHFYAEAVLCFILAFFVIRREGDLDSVIFAACGFGLLVTFAIFFAPASTVGGRATVVEGGTVLSTSELAGTCMILVACADRRMLGSLMKLKIPLVILLAIGCLLTGSRGQFIFAVGLSLLLLASSEGGKKTMVILGVLGAAVGLFAVEFLISNDIILSEQLLDRYSADRLTGSVRGRSNLIEPMLTLDRFEFGHGVMGWAYTFYGVDRYMYPHNAVLQVYYELGFVGLVLFLGVFTRGAVLGLRTNRYARMNGSSNAVIKGVGAMMAYSLLLSLKQGSFMTCLNAYTGAALLAVLYLQQRRVYRYRLSERGQGQSLSGMAEHAQARKA